MVEASSRGGDSSGRPLALPSPAGRLDFSARGAQASPSPQGTLRRAGSGIPRASMESFPLSVPMTVSLEGSASVRESCGDNAQAWTGAGADAAHVEDLRASSTQRTPLASAPAGSDTVGLSLALSSGRGRRQRSESPVVTETPQSAGLGANLPPVVLSGTPKGLPSGGSSSRRMEEEEEVEEGEHVMQCMRLSGPLTRQSLQSVLSAGPEFRKLLHSSHVVSVSESASAADSASNATAGAGDATTPPLAPGLASPLLLQLRPLGDLGAAEQDSSCLGDSLLGGSRATLGDSPQLLPHAAGGAASPLHLGDSPASAELLARKSLQSPGPGYDRLRLGDANPPSASPQCSSLPRDLDDTQVAAAGEESPGQPLNLAGLLGSSGGTPVPLASPGSWRVPAPKELSASPMLVPKYAAAGAVLFTPPSRGGPSLFVEIPTTSSGGRAPSIPLEEEEEEEGAMEVEEFAQLPPPEQGEVGLPYATDAEVEFPRLSADQQLPMAPPVASAAATPVAPEGGLWFMGSADLRTPTPPAAAAPARVELFDAEELMGKVSLPPAPCACYQLPKGAACAADQTNHCRVPAAAPDSQPADA